MTFTSGVCGAQNEGGVVSPAFPRTELAALAGANRVGISADSIPADHPPVPDSFLGSDKVKHFLMSGFIEAVGFSALQLGGASRTSSLVAATVLGAAAGVGRELHDGRTKGLFSLGDLTWDALGIGSALLLISHTQR